VLEYISEKDTIKMKTSLIILIFCICITNVYSDEPPVFSIAEIQQYSGVTEGDRVRVNAIVTCANGTVGLNETVISDPVCDAWTGISVFHETLDAERGDRITLVGTLEEYYDKTWLEISFETEFPPVITGHGEPPDPCELTTGEAAQEMWESVVVRFFDVEVMSDPDSNGIITINDGTGDFYLKLRDEMKIPQIGYTYDCLTGLDNNLPGTFVLFPRDSLDLICPEIPTPTPPATQVSAKLWMPSHSFQVNDACACNVLVNNNSGTQLTGYPLFVLLQIFDSYFWAPSFSTDIDSYLDDYSSFPEGETEIYVLPYFIWPSDVGQMSEAMWIAALTNPDVTEIYGSWDTWEFGWK